MIYFRSLWRFHILLVYLLYRIMSVSGKAKLYFRHGVVSSAKTLNLLAVAHNYRQQGKNVMIFKPALDTRFGLDMVHSRAGLEKKVS
jgi:thymidine kinase